MKKALICMILISCLFAPTISFANTVADCKDNLTNCLDPKRETNEIENHTAPKDNSTTGSLILGMLKTGFALLLILALIYIMVKLLGRRNHLFQQTKVLENLGGISVGQNKSLQMVRVGEKILLIGVGDNIELLEEITDESVIEQVLHINDSHEHQGQLLSTILDRFGQKKASKNDHKHFKNLFSNELNKLKKNREKTITMHKEKENHYE